MGDAAFLLIAREPVTGLLILLIGFFVGYVSGLLVNSIHGNSFMKMNGCDLIRLNCKPSKYKTSKTLDLIWLALISTNGTEFNDRTIIFGRSNWHTAAWSQVVWNGDVEDFMTGQPQR